MNHNKIAKMLTRDFGLGSSDEEGLLNRMGEISHKDKIKVLKIYDRM